MSRPPLPSVATSAAAAAAAPRVARPLPDGLLTMDRPRAPTLRARQALGLALAACWLGGCVTNGDFGRVRHELVTATMHDWVGRDAIAGIGGPPSEFRLTDDELQLRDRAYALIEPPYNRQRFDSVFREYGWGRDRREQLHFDRTAYLRRLHKVYRRSEASAYAQIVV